jgi:hypothetical protein
MTGDETLADFEKPRSTIEVAADIRLGRRSKQLIGAKRVMLCVCFTPIGIIDIALLPPGEAFHRFFFVDIVLDSLTKKQVQIPVLNPEKYHLCI